MLTKWENRSTNTHTHTVLSFKSVIRSLHGKKPTTTARLDSSNRAELNRIFFNKINVAVAVPFSNDLLLIDCIAVPKTLWSDTPSHVCRFEFYVYANCDVLFSIGFCSIFAFLFAPACEISKKIIFYSWFVQKQHRHTKVTDKHLPTKQKHFINMLSQSHSENQITRTSHFPRDTYYLCIHGKPFNILNLSHIANLIARTFFEYAICFD